jgi:hypothetical protein
MCHVPIDVNPYSCVPNYVNAYKCNAPGKHLPASMLTLACFAGLAHTDSATALLQ